MLRANIKGLVLGFLLILGMNIVWFNPAGGPLDVRLPASDDPEIVDFGNNPRPKPWPAKLWGEIQKLYDEGVYSLNNVIFDAIKELETDVYSEEKWKIKAKVKRQVFDNQDVLNTYTVIDAFELRGEARNLSWDIPMATPNVTLGVSVGSRLGQEWTNIRRVPASKYSKLPTIEQEQYDLAEEFGYDPSASKKKQSKFKKFFKNIFSKEARTARQQRRQERRALKKLIKQELKQIEDDEIPFEPTPETEEKASIGNIDFNSDTFTEEEIEIIDSMGDLPVFGPSWRPRTKKIWNLITFPFKLPFNLKRLQKLQDGELISYGLKGFAEVRANAAFKVSPFPIPGDAGVSVGARVFVEGEYKITILKENSRFVRVKKTRVRSIGFGGRAGGSGEQIEVYKGFMLFPGTKLEQKDVLKQKLKVIPFEWKADRKYSTLFDVGYRYDLKYELARQAYLDAVKANFRISQDGEGRVAANGDKAIERIFDRKSKMRGTDQRLKVDLKLVESTNQKKREHTTAVIKLPEGDRIISKDYQELSEEWKVLWGRFEKLNYKFTMAMDQTGFLNDEENSYQLIIEAFMEDSNTSGREMARYINQVEKTIGQKGILPRLPVYIPKLYGEEIDDGYTEVTLEGVKYKHAKYRQSSFYYGFNISQTQLEKLVNLSEEQLWAALEKAFYKEPGKWKSKGKQFWYGAKNMYATILNGPAYLANQHLKQGSDLYMARRIFKNVKRLKEHFNTEYEEKIEQATERMKIFKRMVNTRNFGHELMRFLLFAIQEEEIDYFITATNEAFGRIQERGRLTTNAEYLLQLTDEDIGFERLAGSVSTNPDLIFEKVGIVKEDEKYYLKFNANHVPNVMYFKVQRTTRMKKVKSVVELVIKNTKRFQVGENKLLIDARTMDELSYHLGKELENLEYYTITFASTEDGRVWSKVGTARFRYETDEEKDENEEDEDN
jgi:hypothetical protein